MTAPLYMVFDGESIGLHGEAFAIGYVVIDATGAEVSSGFYRCDPRLAKGAESGRAWVEAHVVPALGVRLRVAESDGCGSPDPSSVREAFLGAWLYWRTQGAVLAADCAWPVEARFLAACVDTDPIARAGIGPYPLIDVASVRFAAGLDPLATVERLPGELPAHHPLADARQSARLLIEALRHVRAVP